ncbi:hypothetical protein Asn12ST33_00435 [Cutibacterium acnes]|nr:hypothetical protein Asn12ST33_00435 [Cutibacterium acnes]
MDDLEITQAAQNATASRHGDIDHRNGGPTSAQINYLIVSRYIYICKCEYPYYNNTNCYEIFTTYARNTRLCVSNIARHVKDHFDHGYAAERVMARSIQSGVTTSSHQHAYCATLAIFLIIRTI